VLWNSTSGGSNNNCSKQFTIQSRWLPLGKDISDTGCKLWSGGRGQIAQSHGQWMGLGRAGWILPALLTQTLFLKRIKARSILTPCAEWRPLAGAPAVVSPPVPCVQFA